METDRLVRKAGKTFTTWRPWLSIKPSANLAGLLALPCRIAEFSCVPPHNEEEKTVDPDELSTTNTKLLNNYFWQMVIWKNVCKRSKTCMLQLRVLEKLIMSRDPEQKNKGSNQQKRRFNSSAASTPFSQILPQDMGLWLVGGFNTPGTKWLHWGWWMMTPQNEHNWSTWQPPTVGNIRII